jgi:hypothetical protein
VLRPLSNTSACDIDGGFDSEAVSKSQLFANDLQHADFVRTESRPYIVTILVAIPGQYRISIYWYRKVSIYLWTCIKGILAPVVVRILEQIACIPPSIIYTI